MSGFPICPTSSLTANTSVGRTCNCGTNDAQSVPKYDPPCCEKALSLRANTTACCGSKMGNEVIFVCGTAPKAVFTGSILTTTLTITSVVSGTILPGMLLSTAAGGTIVSQIAGDTGGAGTYRVSKSQTVLATVLTAFPMTGSTTLTVTEVQTGMITLGMSFTYTLTYRDENGEIRGSLPIPNAIIAFGTGVGGPGTYTINEQAIPDGSSVVAIVSNTNVPLLNTVWEAFRSDPKVWGILAFPGATNVKKRDPLYPTSESARIAKKLITYKPKEAGGTCGFYTTGIPFIAPGCPATPTAILNASLPKPSTRVPCRPTRFEGIRNDCEENFV